MEKKYYKIYTPGVAEVVVKKSKFIGECFSVDSEEQVLEHVAKAKKKYYDARHHCFAYCLLDENSIRASDDGEPSGTAGRPILDVILGENMLNTLIIVTRYFGGTLLGTGGLTRAYKDSAKEAILASEKIEVCKGLETSALISYELYGKVENILRDSGAVLLDTEYGEKVRLSFIASEPIVSGLSEQIQDISSGAATIEIGLLKTYGIIKDRVIWL